MGTNYNHLSEKERELIYSLVYERHLNKSQIANLLCRNRSTISRELKRNKHDFCGYRPFDADGQYHFRISKRAQKGTKLTKQIILFIKYFLKNFKLSPQVITEHIKQKFGVSIHHETIYRHILKEKKKGDNLFEYLPRYKKYRRRFKRSTSKDFHNGVKKRIDERPAVCGTNKRFGDLEADLIIGKGKKVILTMVDRKSKFLVAKLLDSKKMCDVKEGILKGLKEFPFQIKTITTDNGSEFFCYKELEKETNINFYFTNPYHSWEKGLIENRNGLIRRYLNKKSNFEKLKTNLLSSIAQIININPLKCLNNKSPYETVNKSNKKLEFCVVKSMFESILIEFRKEKYNVKRAMV